MFRNTRNVGIFGGTFIDNSIVQHQQHPIPSLSAIGRLMDAASLGALHNSGERFNPPKCHRNTRTAVLQRLLDWLIGKVGRDNCMVWLYGPAGAGKSAIAQTFAEQCYDANDLVASFFFSRSDPNRNNSKALVATLAYQTSLRIPGFWRIIETTINRDPSIFQLNFETQFETLILSPLLQLSNAGLFHSGARLPYLFIIDGLDECKGAENQKAILTSISNTLHQHRLTLPFMFLITSRPEHHLTIPFSGARLSDLTLRLALDDAYQPDKDIKLYLIDSFRDIREAHIMRGHLPEDWPSEQVVSKLVQTSSGQFIYAATVTRYVSSPRHNPTDRLKVIQGLLPVNNDKPYAQLDVLYINILSGVEDIHMTLRIMGISLVLNQFNPIDTFLILPKRTPVTDLERFMLLGSGTIQLMLLDLISVVDVSNEQEPIKFLHASFIDFLLDPTRSFHFHISPAQMHAEVVQYCISHVNTFWNSNHISRANFQLHTLEVAFFSLVDHLQQTGSLHRNSILRGDILKLPYFQSFKNLSDYRRELLWKPKDTNIRVVFVKFLNFLKTSDFCDSEGLYLHHRSIWNHMMLDDLTIVPKSHGLQFWTACLVSVQNFPAVLDLETIMALPSSSEEPQSHSLLYVPLSFFTGETNLHTVTFDGHSHHTASRIDDDWFSINPNYLEILTDFLTDSTQSGIYAASQSTYITAAEFIIKFATRHWDEKKNRVKSYNGQWDLIWDAITSILSRAERSKELISMLSNPNLKFCLGMPLVDVWSSLKSLFRAISEYLLRSVGSIPAGFRVIIDWTEWLPSPGIGRYLDKNIRCDRPFYLDSSINTVRLLHL